MSIQFTGLGCKNSEFNCNRSDIFFDLGVIKSMGRSLFKNYETLWYFKEYFFGMFISDYIVLLSSSSLIYSKTLVAMRDFDFMSILYRQIIKTILLLIRNTINDIKKFSNNIWRILNWDSRCSPEYYTFVNNKNSIVL